MYGSCRQDPFYPETDTQSDITIQGVIGWEVSIVFSHRGGEGAIVSISSITGIPLNQPFLPSQKDSQGTLVIWKCQGAIHSS